MLKLARANRIIIALIIALALSLAAACGYGPPPSRTQAEAFTVISEEQDVTYRSLTVNIKLPPMADEAAVKAAAQSVIDKRRGHYPMITVNSYVDGASSDLPFAVSKLRSGTVEHVFNSAMPRSQPIPTH